MLTPVRIDSPLLGVVTLTEASALVGVHRKSILMRIYQDHIEARQSGATWLVDLESLLSVYPLKLEKGNNHVE
ncbi:MAG: hypothetical protein ACOCX3_03800 [Chloroflexota bacterium]